ncbi:MAG: DUF2490 domain-containing protein [Kiritimatiellales bacterium]
MKSRNFSKVWKTFAGTIVIVAAGLTGTADENDQYWMTGSLSGKLTDKITVKIAGQTRFKDETHYYRHTDFGLSFKLGKGWSISPTFRDVEQKTGGSDNWKSQSGYILDFSNKYKVNAIGMALSSRFRFCNFDNNYNDDSSTDFRPKFTVSSAKGYTSWKLTPYIADEIMYKFDETGKNEGLYRNRVSVGMKFSPIKNLSLDLSIMNEQTESKSNSQWAENWNTCLSAGYKF